MKSAWKELKYDWKKCLLVEIIVILMMFMVLFLSGLVKGPVSSGIENMAGDRFILSDDAEKLITVSDLHADQKKVNELFHEPGIENIMNQYPSSLSGGERH